MTLRLVRLATAALWLAAAASAWAVVPAGGPQSQFTVPHLAGQLLVRTAAGVSPDAITDVLAPFGGAIAAFSTSAQIHVATITNDSDLPAAITALNADPRFAFAQPNYLFETTATPNDLDFAQQWSKDNTGVNAPGGLGNPGADMNMVNAWNTRTTAPGIVIAIIDDSVETSHIDLAANILPGGKCFASPDSARPCSNGPNDPNPADSEDFHGTLVAGAAAARGNNGIGIAGTVWETGILPLKVDLTSFAIVNAIDEAIAQGADIINMSFGGPVQGSAQQEAINRAEMAGLLIVASAGNADANNDIATHFPSDSINANVLSVAATTGQDKIAGFSQWAPFSVHIAAPGESIRTTATSNGYASASGTSFSAPHIAGVAALVKAETGAADYRQVKAHLVHGGVNGVGTLGPVVPGQNKRDVPGRVASGRIDANRALTGPSGGVLVIRGVSANDNASGNGNGVLEPGETALLEITLANLWLAETAVTGTLSTPDTGLLSVNTTSPVLFGSIGQDATATAAFSVTLSGTVTGNEQIFLQLALSTATSPNSPTRYLYLETGALSNGVTVAQQIQRWDWDEFHAYQLDVPVGASNLTFNTTGTGDIDLLVRHQQSPEYLISLGGGSFYYVDSNSRSSGGPGATETVSIPNPLPGLYHVVVVNFDQTAKTYELTASYAAAGAGDIAYSAGAFQVNESAGNAVITVIRTGGVGAASVDYSTTAASASAGLDYTDVSGTLTWAVGETGGKTFAIPVVDDAAAEPQEAVTLGLSNPSGATLGAPSVATLEIIDNDSSGGVVAFTQNEYTVAESQARAIVTVLRSGSSSGVATVDFSTQAGTASSGLDYSDTSGTLTWQDGESGTRSIEIPVLNDTANENSESVAVRLINPAGAALGVPNTATLTITDDDSTAASTGGSGGGGTGLELILLLLVLRQYRATCRARTSAILN